MPPWVSLTLVLACLKLITNEVTGTPPSSTDDNFYSYRADYDDDFEYSRVSYHNSKQKGRNDYYDDDESDSAYRRDGEDWVQPGRGGWSSGFQFNRNHPRPPVKSHKVSNGWGKEEIEEQSPHQWSPPRRRKPSYVVKIRRPVKKDPGWIYFRPPAPGRVTPGSGWPSTPHSPESPHSPIRKPQKHVNSWEEENPISTGNYGRDASYSFSYDAGDHERSEYADPWGTVRGSYSYVDPTGVRRTVHYTAGAATGFKILSAQPSNTIENIYRDPIVVRKKPSAFVYHLHPDGGWKPWEGRKGEGKGRSHSSPNDEEVPHHIHSGSGNGDEELALDETRTPGDPYRKSTYAEDSQSISHQHDPQAVEETIDDKMVDSRGYEKGYDDKNGPELENNKRISTGKMMALRMRRKKGDPKANLGSPGISKPHRRNTGNTDTHHRLS